MLNFGIFLRYKVNKNNTTKLKISKTGSVWDVFKDENEKYLIALDVPNNIIEICYL